jgi:hypothetical protein
MDKFPDPTEEIVNGLQWQISGESDAFENKTLDRLHLFLYMVPVFGLIPAGLTLANRKSSRQHRSASRLCISVTLSWAMLYALLNLGVGLANETSGTGLSLLILNGLLTSGYFLTSYGLMIKLWQNQPLNLPGFSRIAKHLP